MYLNFDKDELKEFVFRFEDKLLQTSIGPFDRVNLFVGANNSRKSRFLRHLISRRSMVVSNESSINTTNLLNVAITELSEMLPSDWFFRIRQYNMSFSKEQLGRQYDPEHPVRIFVQNYKRDLTISRDELNTLKNLIGTTSFPTGNARNDIIKDLLCLSSAMMLSLNYNHYRTDPIIRGAFQVTHSNPYTSLSAIAHESATNLISAIEGWVNFDIEEIEPTMHIIPVLRGMHRLYSNTDDRLQYAPELIYHDTFVGNYNIRLSDSEPHVTQVHTGQDLYTRIRRIRNSPKKDRAKFEAFERFLSIAFFNGSEIEIVSQDDSSVVHLFVEGDEDRRLENVGDGIQAIIQLMFPVFIAENHSWIIIEEPEMNLHPGFITLFLNTIVSNKELLRKNLRYFISTHSNHLLDLSLTKASAISIFSLENELEEQRSSIRLVESGDTRLLDILGVSNSSVFMAKTSLWVEGISDRMLVSAFVKAKLRHVHEEGKYNEDFDYAFFEYAGSNLAHYLFDKDAQSDNTSKIKAYFLSNRMWVLADQDKQDWKQKRHSELELLNTEHFQYVTTGVLEIENALSVGVWKLLLVEVFGLNQSKVNRMRFEAKDYEAIRVGDFFKARFVRNDKKYSTYFETNGQLKASYKVKVAKAVVQGVEDGIIDWGLIADNLAAENIVESLLSFLQRNVG